MFAQSQEELLQVAPLHSKFVPKLMRKWTFCIDRKTLFGNAVLLSFEDEIALVTNIVI